ncbi:MAG: carboxypeptidase-like regulatory domain-containing protein [Flavobacteriales bacterium]
MKAANALKLSIPTPCHEDWNAMTPQDRGRHCASCAKVVTDFSGMTDQELITYLKNGAGSGCGRFRKDQIDRVIKEKPVQRLWSFPRFLAASVISYITAIGSALGQSNEKQRVEVVEMSVTGEYMPVKHNTATITGNVSSNGEPIPFVNVTVVGQQLPPVFTDFDGNYSITIPRVDTIEDLEMEFSSIGYNTKRVIEIGDGRIVNVELRPVDYEVIYTMGLFLPLPETREAGQNSERVYDSRLKSNPR